MSTLLSSIAVICLTALPWTPPARPERDGGSTEIRKLAAATVQTAQLAPVPSETLAHPEPSGFTPCLSSTRVPAPAARPLVALRAGPAPVGRGPPAV